MRTRLLLATAVLSAGASASLACSCFGPQTFCETLDPPFPNPEWWIPDAVVFGVKLSDYQHGMDVKIVQSFSGALQPDDTIRVWGDCGLLCRHYPGTWAVGDTVIWGFKVTDLAGNSLCGTSFEQPTDYMISICGVYYLDYANGIVSGPIAPGVNSLSLPDFIQQMESCFVTTSIQEVEEEELIVWYDGEVPVVEMPSISGLAELSVVDVEGRSVLSRSWDGHTMRIERLGSGVYFLEVRGASKRQLRKLVIGGAR